MPRIRRWHPVSHDFVRDREAQELRLRFGHWMTDVWLEMLSEADKNKGVIKGDAASIAKGLAWVSLSDRPSFSRGKIFNAIEYMLNKGWIEEGTNCFLVCNYLDYHITREKKDPPEGIHKPPLLPSCLNRPFHPTLEEGRRPSLGRPFLGMVHTPFVSVLYLILKVDKGVMVVVLLHFPPILPMLPVREAFEIEGLLEKFLNGRIYAEFRSLPFPSFLSLPSLPWGTESLRSVCGILTEQLRNGNGTG